MNQNMTQSVIMVFQSAQEYAKAKQDLAALKAKMQAGE